MALVSEMVTPGGVRVRVFDDLYRDASPEEIRRRRGAAYRAMIAMIAEREEQESRQNDMSKVDEQSAKKSAAALLQQPRPQIETNKKKLPL